MDTLPGVFEDQFSGEELHRRKYRIKHVGGGKVALKILPKNGCEIPRMHNSLILLQGKSSQYGQGPIILTSYTRRARDSRQRLPETGPLFLKELLSTSPY
ncbi:unnamed protein product [Ceutorhynchus assimilis]|uniref:Uncharacterized protein n=1 Tax=Ceutorhynchus assimilis TaxID=467358 RepID=A0A9N9QQG1_9CUCU|nr:unnamed protein product [Ceutorhynchus assimilis]